MAAIRIMFQTDAADASAQLQAITKRARGVQGCLHAEDFHSVERDGHYLHVELWESPAAWDGAGADHHAALTRATAQAEFYKQACFMPTGPSWNAVADRAETIRWPAQPGPIRILILVGAPAEAPADFFIQNSIETRAEPGCLAFEYFRSVDFPENVALIESWASPAIYDAHWHHRIAQNQPPPPPPPPRRYGEMSFEWYPECVFAQVDGVWTPADPAARMDTVYW